MMLSAFSFCRLSRAGPERNVTALCRGHFRICDGFLAAQRNDLDNRVIVRHVDVGLELVWREGEVLHVVGRRRLGSVGFVDPLLGRGLRGRNRFPQSLLGNCVGTLAGGLNGLLVTRLRLPPFIVTLGTLNIFTALTLLVSNGASIQGKDIPAARVHAGRTLWLVDGAALADAP